MGYGRLPFQQQLPKEPSALILWLKKRYGRFEAAPRLALRARTARYHEGRDGEAVVPPDLSKRREATPDRGLVFLDIFDVKVEISIVMETVEPVPVV